MPIPVSTSLDERVLVLAPTAADGVLCRAVLAEAGLGSHVCVSFFAMSEAIKSGAGAVLLTEAAFVDADPTPLVHALLSQPDWSDLPVLLLAGGGPDAPAATLLLELLNGATVLDRPVRTITLISSLRSAIRGRQRQYELRDRLEALRQAQTTLRASEAQFRQLVEASMEGIWQVDRSGRTTYINARLGQMLGERPDAIIGRGILEFVHSDDRAQFDEAWKLPLAGLPHSGEWRFRRPDGRDMWLYASAAPVRDGDRDVVGVFAMMTDVTGRRAAENALRESSRRKDEFLATLAHELRNPLAPIRYSLHMLRRSNGAATAPATGVVEMVERQVDHMVRLVDDLMEISRITRGTIRLRKEAVELSGVVRSATEASRPLIESWGHRLEVSLPEEPVTLIVDPVRMTQILANLLNNAAKYTPEGGLIRLEARNIESPERGQRQVAISIRDNGMGIPPSMQHQVFEMFNQVDRSLNRSQGGLGIGLALVKSLVEMHGGTVEAKSEGAGRGSEFIVRMPAGPGSWAHGANGAGHEPSDACLAARNILVVDDNNDAADSLSMLLTSAGAEVNRAYDGASAVDLAATQRPDVVLLDLGMPGMTGYEVARRLREKPELADTVLIALTGWGGELDRDRSHAAGFDYHLVKPIEFGTLSRLLASLPTPAHGSPEESTAPQDAAVSTIA